MMIDKGEKLDAIGLGSPLEVKNEFLSILTGDSLRFSSGATGQVTGLPYNLIYGWPNSTGTSDTSVWVDGTAVYFGDTVSGTIIQPPTISVTPEGKTVSTCLWKYGDIYVTQTLRNSIQCL